MTTSKEGWHYITVKELLALLRDITLKQNGDCYCLICLHSTWNKLEPHKKVCEDKDFFVVVMPSEDTEEFNQYFKLDKAPFII